MQQIWLELQLNNHEFNKIVKHIHMSMFFGVKRIAPNLRHIILHSVGDNIGEIESYSDYSKADIFLEKQIPDNTIDNDSITEILKNLNWYLKLTCEGEYYAVTIDKRTDTILDRSCSKKAMEYK